MEDEILESSKNVADLTSAERADEYFRIRSTLKTLRGDLKDLKDEHPDYEDLKKVVEKAKQVRMKIDSDENIHALKEKIGGLKERQELLKEIIKIQLIDEALDEVTNNGRKLKLVQVLKEMKDEDIAKAELPN